MTEWLTNDGDDDVDDGDDDGDDDASDRVVDQLNLGFSSSQNTFGGKSQQTLFLFWEHFWRDFAFWGKPVSTRGLLFRADEDDWTLASIDV